MIIQNGMVFAPDGIFRQGDITISDGKIKRICYGKEHRNGTTGESPESIVDASGYYIIPGMVDIHFHGCVGYDFCDGTKEAFDAICDYQARCGVTDICPATMTLEREELARIFRAAGAYRNMKGSRLRGINMEGPFVSVKKKGAQNADFIHRPDVAFYRQMQELSGHLIKQVAVAPEEDEGYEFIREVSQETVVSVAHTTAGYDIAMEAFRQGATHVTHLFNAMPPFGHRDPGVVGAALDNPDVYVELICDGVHIHPSVVRAVFALFGAKRVCLVSDSMMAAGMSEGSYALGGQTVTVSARKATLADGTIAGSASGLHECLKIAVQEMGIPVEDAVMACTATPADSLGLGDVCGRIAVDREANLVMLDTNLDIQKVWINGTEYV